MGNCKVSLKGEKDNTIDLSVTETDANTIVACSVSDSIYKFFPDLTVLFKDNTGAFYEQTLLAEGMKFKFEMSYMEEFENYLSHDFHWGGFRTVAPILESGFAGELVLDFSSTYRDDNEALAEAYTGTIGSVVATASQKYFKGTIPKIAQTFKNIARTYYTGDNTPREFFQNLSEIASAPKKSPVFTFISLNKELYFQDVDSMLSNPPLPDLKLRIDYDSVQGRSQANVAKSHSLNCSSEVTNVNLHKINHSYFSSTNSYSTQTSKLKDYSIESGKQFIYKGYAPERRSYLGLFSKNQVNDVSGTIDQKYNKSVFTFRIVIEIPFNGFATSGRVVDLKIKNVLADNEGLSGRWVIIASQHSYDAKPSPVCSSLLTLARNFHTSGNLQNIYEA